MYRIDRRQLSLGEEIKASGEYCLSLDGKGKSVELALERKRPCGKLKRSSALFLFIDYCDALKFWTKAEDGKFYEVQPAIRISHIGDMELTETMFKSMSNLNGFARSYWQGNATAAPCWEILAAAARIAKIISNLETERRAVQYWRQGYDPEERGFPNVEKLVNGCYPRPTRTWEKGPYSEP